MGTEYGCCSRSQRGVFLSLKNLNHMPPCPMKMKVQGNFIDSEKERSKIIAYLHHLRLWRAEDM